jgi:hypothetical protein
MHFTICHLVTGQLVSYSWCISDAQFNSFAAPACKRLIGASAAHTISYDDTNVNVTFSATALICSNQEKTVDELYTMKCG